MRKAGAALALLLVAGPALARDSQLPLRNGLTPLDQREAWGLGFTLGTPFGLTLKRYLAGSNSWDAYVALAYGPGLRVGADWLWGLGRLEQHAKFELDLYAGVGPFVGALQGPCGPGFFPDRCNGDAYAGGRVPVGVELLLREVPLALSLEVAPGLGFGPGRAGFLLDLDLGIRWLFR